MSFSETLDKRIDIQEDYVGNEGFDKMIKYFRQQRPKPYEFNDIFSDEEIKKDMDDLFHAEQSFNEDFLGKKAKALEYIVMAGIKYGWLNDDEYKTDVIPSSRYDDAINHTDCVINFLNPETNEETFLGIDVTISQRINEIDNKIRYIADNLKNKKTNKIKYYKSPKTNTKGEITLPRVIIAISPEKIDHLIEIIGDKKTEEIKNDIVQYEFIQEIENQLLVYLKFIISKFLDITDKENDLLIKYYNLESIKNAIKVHQEEIDQDAQLKDLISLYLTPLTIISAIKNKKRKEFKKNEPSLSILSDLQIEHLDRKLARLTA
ncbi:MAG: hypothetical protein PHS07_03705 [Patescibacteria group bacterium]|jgi:hypothetical protein|nr:hypothetical protein [Patescibacteria group bacterium]